MAVLGVQDKILGEAIKACIVLKEGKNRQIRRICQKVGLPVLQLKRIRIKDLILKNLPEGEWRYLTPEEVKSLKQ